MTITEMAQLTYNKKWDRIIDRSDLGQLKIIPKEMYIPEFKQRQAPIIKTINKNKTKSDTIELF